MLVPAYATTIHKRQGSEYPAVVIPVMTQRYAMWQRNLLYTGVTRAIGRVGRSEEGGRHRGAQRLGSATVVEAAGMAASWPAPRAAVWHGGLSHGGSGFSARCAVAVGLLGLQISDALN